MRDRIELIIPRGREEQEEKRLWEVGSIRPGSNEDIKVSREYFIAMTLTWTLESAET